MTKAIIPREARAQLRVALSEISLEEYVALGWQQKWWSAVREVGPYCRVDLAKRMIN